MASLRFQLKISAIYKALLYLSVSANFALCQKCGDQILTAKWERQMISTPGYPNMYSNDLNCTWLITVTRGSQIELKLFIVDIEPQYDTLKIYDGKDENAPLLSALSGNVHVQTPTFSSTGFLFLRFTSDNSVTKKGFRAHYRIALPAITNITSVIQSSLAETTITREIKNLDSEAREVNFRIIFPASAYITQFEMTIGGIVYFGKVERKESIRQKYEEVDVEWVSMGYVSSTKDLAKRFFFGILLQPGKTAKFEIVYQQLLQRRLGRYTNTFVLTRDFLLSDLSVDVYICARSKLSFVQVPRIEDAGSMSYIGQVRFLERKDFSPENVKVSKEGNIAHISFRSTRHGINEPISSKRNVFVTHYDVHRGDTGTLSVFGGEYFATFYSPDKPNLARRIVFVLDVSGSMAGNKINQVKIAFNNILNRLSRRDAFNIVQFESVIRKWHRVGLVLATPKAKASAKQYINTFDPEGQTNVNNALLTGLELLIQGVPNESIRRKVDVNPYRDFIFFLGDGKPTVGVRNSLAILRNVRIANRRGYGINTIGFGRNVDMDFLRWLTRENDGKWRIIYDDDESHLQIQNFITEIGVPTVTDVTFSFDKKQVNYTTRRRNLVLVNGGEVAVFGRLLPNLTVKDVKINVIGRTFKIIKNSFGFDVSKNQAQCESMRDKLIKEFVERAYGITKLEETLKKLRQSTDSDENRDITKELVDLSLQFNLVTPVTSLVVRTRNETREKPRKPEIIEKPNNKEEEPKKPSPGEIVEKLPGKLKPWVFEGDPHFVIALNKNITVCFTWNGTDGQIYNLLHDPVTGITLNGLIRYGPKPPNATTCNGTASHYFEDKDLHSCQEDIESFFVKLGVFFFKEKVKIEVTPKEVIITDERYPKHVVEEILPASDEKSRNVVGGVAVTVHNITKVHSFVNITLNGTVTFMINMKRGRNLPNDKKRPGLVDHLDMDIIGHKNLSPDTEGLFGLFPKNVESQAKDNRKYPKARLRKSRGKAFLLYRKHRIAVEEISIQDPYTKEPRECLFTYEETLVTGKMDDEFTVNGIFGSPKQLNIDFSKDV